MKFDLDELRIFIMRCHGSTPVRRARLHYFDLYRYNEEYEKIYKMVTDLGGIIE